MSASARSKRTRPSIPIGIPLTAPSLSWQLTSSGRGTVQSGYQVRVATSEGGLSDPDVWDSGKIESRDSVEVPYGGPDLEGATVYAWQVRVWDGKGQASELEHPRDLRDGARLGRRVGRRRMDRRRHVDPGSLDRLHHDLPRLEDLGLARRLRPRA